MIRINKGFIDEETENYAKTASHILQQRDDLIDCSLGVNPYGISKKVINHINEFNIDHINYYPESNDSLKEILLKYWEPVITLMPDQVQLTHGAMGACELVNKILLNENAKVLGYCPQFTDYIFDVEKCGAAFEYISLKKEDNYAFDTSEFLEAINESFTAVYIDNPNNPTGQVISISDIEKIVKKASECGVAVIIDEAYGDYMSDSNSSACLVNTYENLFVIRSFSKAFGMAGLRVGYVVLPMSLVRYFEKVLIAFPINSLGQFFAHFILDDRQFLVDCVKNIKASNQLIQNSVRKLTVATTSDELPISTISHPDPSINLYEEFLAEGVLTNSCASYLTLDKSSVRLRVPVEIERVIKAIENIEKRINQG